jgi:hypothetical protein
MTQMLDCLVNHFVLDENEGQFPDKGRVAYGRWRSE